MQKSYDILEIDKVVEQIYQYAKTPYSQYLISSLKPYSDRRIIKREYQKISELIEVVFRFGDLPISSHLNVGLEIENIKKGNILDEYKLNLLKDEIYNTGELIAFYRKTNVETKLIKEMFNSMKQNMSLYERIIKTISTENTVYDNATVELARARKGLKEIDKRIHKALNSYLQANSSLMTGDNYVLRNGHYAVPVNTNLKNSIKGVIHDISDSGQTTFIEPYEISELENEKSVLEMQEKEEVYRILKELSGHVLFDSQQLIINNKTIGQLDFIACKIKYLRKFKCTIPHITNDTTINFYGARHPLMNQDQVIANDFVFNSEKPMMIISGPNAGGKTVALKTIGVLTYLTKMAIPITAQEGSECGVVSNIYVDIGDNQSLEANLSTFSAHINSLSVILQSVNSNDLVLIDEIGNGTDPKEGEALSISIVQYLLEKNCISAITSHFPLLKKYGLENRRIQSASFIFDEEKINSTFKIMLGVTGKSFGFVIGEKYGIPQEIIKNAKSFYNDNYMSKEDLKLEFLEDKERTLFFKMQQYEERINELEEKEAFLKQKEEKMNEKEENLKNRKIEELDNLINEKSSEINAIYNEFLKEKNLKKTTEQLALINIEDSIIDEFSVGDYAEVKGMNTKGKITRISGNKITLNTDSGFSINSTPEMLRKINTPSKIYRKNNDLDDKILNGKNVSMSLNLVGYRVFEALEALDSYIANARTRNINQVKIIHGYGTGKLRQGIWDHLKTSRFVESFELGNSTNGGTGSTIVKLK